MTDENWFSATLRFFYINSVAGKTDAEDAVFLVKAVDFKDAFQKFLRLGQQNEIAYKNHLSEEIRKRLAEITTLDIIRSEDLNGAEVACRPNFEADPQVTFETPLDPARSDPSHSI